MSNTAGLNILSLTEIYDGGTPGWRTDGGVQFAVPNAFAPTGTPGNYDFSGYGRYLDQIKANLLNINTLRLFVNDYTFDDPQKQAYWKGFIETAAAKGYQLIITFADGEISNSQNDPQADWPRIVEIAEGWDEILTWINATPAVENAVYGYELLNEPECYSQGPVGAALYIDHLRQIFQGSDLWGDKKILVGGQGASRVFEHLAGVLQFADGSTGTGIDAIKSLVGAGNLVWSFHTYSQWAMSQSAASYVFRKRSGANSRR